MTKKLVLERYKSITFFGECKNAYADGILKATHLIVQIDVTKISNLK